MAGHLKATGTVTVGNDTEGIKVDEELIAELFPDLSDAHVANNMRGYLRFMLVMAYWTRQPGMAFEQAVNHVNQHVEDTH